MGREKSKAERDHEIGVEEGQKGDFMDDLAHGVAGSHSSSYGKGYIFGADHRYDSDGERYHSKDGSGSNDSKDSSDGSSSSSGSGGCFLSTACVEARGLPDGCLELQILRNFRDNVLCRSPRDSALVKEYYRTAPLLIERINMQPHHQAIYDGLFEQLVVPTVRLIRQGKYDGAIAHYKEHVQRLNRLYSAR